MFRLLLLTMLVVGGPVQAQLAHFCEVMEQAVEACCCAHDEQQPFQHVSGGCPEGGAGECCRTVVSLVMHESAPAAIPAAGKQGVSAHDPPPIATSLAASLPAAEPRAVVRAAWPRPDLAGHGTQTFLRTLRLRL